MHQSDNSSCKNVQVSPSGHIVKNTLVQTAFSAILLNGLFVLFCSGI